MNKSNTSFLSLALMLCLLSSVLAFQSPLGPSAIRPTTQLGVNNLFGGLFGGGDSQQQQQSQGPKPVIDLPADSVKVGALKFFLQIYLVGEQNKPTQGSWVLNNNDEGGSIDMYYKDGTGMFSLAVEDTSIQVRRYGAKPSLEYMLQESVFLHGILDEISNIAFDTEDIEQDKRLIQFADDDIIDKARESLPARKAD